MAFPAFRLKRILLSMFRLPQEEYNDWTLAKRSSFTPFLLFHLQKMLLTYLFTTWIHISIHPVLSTHEIVRKLVNLFSILWEHLDYPSRLFFTFRYFGPSGVRALPLASGRNVGGHYKWHFFPFSLSLFFRLIANSHRRDCHMVLKFCMGS